MAISVVEGDLTAQAVDVLVNAANEHLAHGGGVAAAIVRAGGQVIQQESDAWVREHGPIGAGRAAVTSAGKMPARWVVHVVGPRYRPGQNNEGLLGQAVRAALEAAAELDARSVAMPAISTGIFGYPRSEACRVIVTACREWLAEHPGPIEEVRLVGYDRPSAQDFRDALA